ncbi:[Pyruvate dehydrogenase (acetyl-transferring)] kinase 1, mitochondrial [[Candida] railenensis]|uniref:Protein-serine/threonine kinase n=1 Tax=[Candida] railenensis TaxID=45579 RepID=A0A9P0QQB8_9ASCO|nr:[Pyruvate dehydrogenase (acetyl-transferring)] kinase 1, mitochondrial [[Candida] railenensis]
MPGIVKKFSRATLSGGFSIIRRRQMAGVYRSLHLSPIVSESKAGVKQQSQQENFLEEYRTRSQLERIIHHYSSKPLPQFSLSKLYEQSTSLNDEYILQNARDTIEHLLVFNARRLQQFRTLPYLVVLNPSISESYEMYLNTMSLLITSLLHLPKTLEENVRFSEDVLKKFIEVHMDTLPGLSKGFQEVSHLIHLDQIKQFLDNHLVERIRMRLVAHQHIQLTETISNGGSGYEVGGRYNGVIKLLNISEIIRNNAEHVNDLFLMKYDQSVPIKIDNNLYPDNFWAKKDLAKSKNNTNSDDIIFPYIEYHLDYILTELFKNSFRAHIENQVSDPVQITISVSQHSSESSDPPSYLEIRIRDKGKGIPKHIIGNMFDYSFTTYDSGEGDSYKTLNVPPGLGGNTVAGMGYGLPLSKNYIQVFNDTQGETGTKGSLTIQSYLGWGTDVYLKAVGS